ncbi:hypothetical protein [Larkinella rosea]|uniref:DUF4595 domain-containing protein n=1 Tax=Larkinella rosea TaxID=2025312 RepID=A0A3P1BFF6_9BACT|nr:hypothetical protein [Larkinella rosea]RRA99816.1 hypothetical protein EHT25_24600 [Larkinella rosea]
MKLFIQSHLLIVSFVFLFGSCAIEDHLRPANPNCHLDKVVEKFQVTDGSNPEEMIEIEGQKIPISTTPNSSIAYKYDPQGRVIEKHQNRYIYYYEYLPNNDIKWVAVPDPSLPYSTSTTGTFILDSQGLFSNAANRFDSEGFRVFYNEGTWKLESTITNGNVSKTVRNETRSEATTEYEYDLTQPNKIPNPEPHFGKVSRNMLVRQKYKIIDSNGSGYYILTEFKYVYDLNGQVKSLIGVNNKYGFDKDYNIDYTTKSDTYYTIIDYTITCQ